jgi:hypothetical protein
MTAVTPDTTVARLMAGIPAVFAALLLTGPALAESDIAQGSAAPAGERQSRSRQFSDGRSSVMPVTITEDRYAPLATSGERSAAGRMMNTGKLALAQNGSEQAASEDFWFFHADVQLFNDDDHDGYYHGIDVLFDVDTIFETADVYAVLYLSYEGGPWNEYAVTDTFRIFGATSDDEYVVVTELTSGYPRGNYDLLIDLYDTWDGSLVATLGPEDSSALSYLPLEDFNRDDPDGGDTVVVVDGGGALDAWTVLAGLLYVLAIWLVRRRQRAYRLREG